MNSRSEKSLMAEQWENAIGARVRATMASPEIERYFNIRMTPARARIALLQLSLFIQCRRDCWANLIANCDALPIRQRLMEHEYDELVEDEYSSKGHYGLAAEAGCADRSDAGCFRQCRAVENQHGGLLWLEMDRARRLVEGWADCNDGDRMG
jgi:hypothetical protein